MKLKFKQMVLPIFLLIILLAAAAAFFLADRSIQKKESAQIFVTVELYAENKHAVFELRTNGTTLKGALMENGLMKEADTSSINGIRPKEENGQFWEYSKDGTVLSQNPEQIFINDNDRYVITLSMEESS